MYYFGQQGTHARQAGDDRGVFGIGRVVQTRDRWMGLGSDSPMSDPAVNGTEALLPLLTSRPVALPQCTSPTAKLTMSVNANIGVGGNLTLALLSVDGKVPLDGYAHDSCVGLMGNRLGAIVSYRRAGTNGYNGYNVTTDLSPVAHATPSMRLQWRLRPPARIFAWKFTCVDDA